MNSFRLLMLVMAGAAFVPNVEAQDYASRFVVPHAAYPGDHIFVPAVGGGGCNAARLDPDRPPQIRGGKVYDDPSNDDERDTYIYTMSYWLRNRTGIACGTPPPAPDLPVDVGPLPLGVHRFILTGHLEGTVFRNYETSTTWVRKEHGLHSDISGLWHDPSQHGRGLSVVPIRDGSIMMFWATHDGEGKPLWVVSHGPSTGVMTFGGLAVRTDGPPLASGPSTSPQQPWGQIKFTYVGCGRARFEWTPLDTTIAPGSQTLVKLAQSKYEERCSLDAQARAVWID